MILDKYLEFGDALAIAMNATNAILPSGSVIDLGSAPTLKNIGSGQPVYLVLTVGTDFAGAGNLTFDLCSDSTENLATSKTTHLSTGAIAYTAWTAGTTKVYPLPIEATYERYLGIWETASGNCTGGTLNAFLTCDPNYWTALPDAL
jgi:hypothetical protein